MVPVHDPVSKPTTQCTYHHIQCTLQHTATLCSLQPSIQCTASAHTAAAITSLVHTLQQPLHLHCTHCSSHYIFSAHTTAAITSSVHTAAMYNHVQLSAANLQCTLQPTAANYNHLHYSYTIQCTLQPYYLVHTAAIPFSTHCSYTIQCTLQLHYLMPIPYSASSEEG